MTEPAEKGRGGVEAGERTALLTKASGAGTAYAANDDASGTAHSNNEKQTIRAQNNNQNNGSEDGEVHGVPSVLTYPAMSLLKASSWRSSSLLCSRQQHQQQQHTSTCTCTDCDCDAGTTTPTEFYYPAHNPTIQRYYSFRASPLTPFAALHKRPGTSPDGTAEGSSSSSLHSKKGPNQSGVTGLLRRSAGTSILVSFILFILLLFI
jgi:hypothetical protein